MGSLLRLIIPTVQPTPLLGNAEITGGTIAFALESVFLSLSAGRDRLMALDLPENLEEIVTQLMERRRLKLEERFRRPPGQPYDAEAYRAELREEKELLKLQSDLGQKNKRDRVAAELPPLEDALRREADFEVSARVFQSALSEVERLCRNWILLGKFEWAECRLCDRQYAKQEFEKVEWSHIGAPRAGIGGERMTCPAGHVIYAMQTWVS